MDGIITPDTLRALEAQAAQEQINLSQSNIRPSLERDAALVAEYARKASQQVRQPSSISEFFFKGPVVPIEERLGYAREASRLQEDIQRRIQEAGLMQGPMQPTAHEPVAAQQQPIQQPTPSPAPAAPEAATASKEKEKPQYDPFAEFNRTNEIKQKFYDIALAELSQLPVSQRAAGLKLVGEIWNAQGPKPPQNMAVPLIDAMTGKPLEGFALVGGKVEKIEKPKVEEDGRSVIGYEGKVPTQTEAIKFREQVSDINSGVSALDELIQLGRKGSSLSPTDRARAQNLARMIQGKFRLEIVGPGAVTENDRKVLEDVVASPLDIFRLSDVPTLLTDMKSRMLSARDEKARSLGLKPTGQPSQPSQGGGGGFYFNTKTGKMEAR